MTSLQICVTENVVECGGTRYESDTTTVLANLESFVRMLRTDLCPYPCMDDPCAHGGSCTVIGVDGFVCECPDGWIGHTCENGNSFKVLCGEINYWQ